MPTVADNHFIYLSGIGPIGTFPIAAPNSTIYFGVGSYSTSGTISFEVQGNFQEFS